MIKSKIVSFDSFTLGFEWDRGDSIVTMAISRNLNPKPNMMVIPLDVSIVKGNTLEPSPNANMGYGSKVIGNGYVYTIYPQPDYIDVWNEIDMKDRTNLVTGLTERIIVPRSTKEHKKAQFHALDIDIRDEVMMRLKYKAGRIQVLCPGNNQLLVSRDGGMFMSAIHIYNNIGQINSLVGKLISSWDYPEDHVSRRAWYLWHSRWCRSWEK